VHPYVSRADQAEIAAITAEPNVNVPTMAGTFDPAGATTA
jgi:hypothetical protein